MTALVLLLLSLTTSRYYKTLGCEYRNDDDDDDNDDDDDDKERDAVASTCMYEQASGNGDWSDFVHLIKVCRIH